ncbi:hypothetical protein QFZ71_002982 [Streptomyces sp. V2I9]|nr:hypothetical protein [Streptomyces sp. V2I9]
MFFTVTRTRGPVSGDHGIGGPADARQDQTPVDQLCVPSRYDGAATRKDSGGGAGVTYRVVGRS